MARVRASGKRCSSVQLGAPAHIILIARAVGQIPTAAGEAWLPFTGNKDSHRAPQKCRCAPLKKLTVHCLMQQVGARLARQYRQTYDRTAPNAVLTHEKNMKEWSSPSTLSNQVCNPTARGTQTVGRISTNNASDLIIRHCCSSKQVHLLRFLPRTTTQALAAPPDARTEEAYCSLNSVPKLDTWRTTAVRMPLRFGGLGTRSLGDTMDTAHKSALTQAEPQMRQSARVEFADPHNSF